MHRSRIRMKMFKVAGPASNRTQSIFNLYPELPERLVECAEIWREFQNSEG